MSEMENSLVNLNIQRLQLTKVMLTNKLSMYVNSNYEKAHKIMC